MLREPILKLLEELRLGGMRNAYDELMAGLQKKAQSPEKFFHSGPGPLPGAEGGEAF